MNTLLMIGNHPRHFWIAKTIQSLGILSGLVIENRRPLVPKPPQDLENRLRKLFIRHFKAREQAEHAFFGNGENFSFSGPTLRIKKEELNSKQTQSFIKRVPHELALSYGVHILQPETLSCMGQYKWNIHGGLSPWYRGAITHFWPSYLLEPQMTGVTLHELTQNLDGGSIVHQCVPELIRGDGICELACRAVHKFASELLTILRLLDERKLSSPMPQSSSGKLWLTRDWHPQHLRFIYETFQNRIVDAYLDGKLKKSVPLLKRQFD